MNGVDINLVLGMATYGVDPDEELSWRMLDYFREQGGRIVDTARCYSDWVPGEVGRSECLLGRWLKSRRCRDEIIISSKGGHPPMDAMDRTRLSRQELEYDVQASLQALGVDCMDLYWLHRDDLEQPVGALLETLELFCERGWIKHYGASNFTTERLKAAAVVAEQNGWQGFSGNQPMGCLGGRYRKPMEIPLLTVFDAAMEGYHQSSQLALYPYTSQAVGYYDKVKRLGVDHPSLSQHPFHTDGCRKIADRLMKISCDSGDSISALTLAWWRTKSYPAHPIIGCRTYKQLQQSLASASVSQATLDKLADIEV